MSPAGSAKPSPEERLLNLIRGKPARPSPTPAFAPLPPVAAGSPSAAGGTFVREQLQQWPKLAIIVLSVVLGLEAVYLVYQLVRPLPTVSNLDVIAQPPPGTASPPADGAPEASPFDMPSVAASASRDLFVNASAITASSRGDESHGVPSQVASQLAARLTLKGIMSGHPGQAIIEDTQTQKSFFVSPGQPVVEGAVLEQILDNRVILDLQGEQIELSL